MAIIRHPRNVNEEVSFIRWLKNSTMKSGVPMRVKSKATLLDVARRIRRAK